MNIRNKELLKSALLVFGAFAFAYNASIILHELGHAIGYWLTGGGVGDVIIHPFAWSRISASSASTYSAFTTWSGVLFGSLLGLLIFFLIWRWRSPYTLPILLIGIVSCLHNGFYFLYDCLAQAGADASSLLSRGTPQILVISAGVLLIVIGLFLASICLPLIGIGSSHTFISRVIIFFGGVVPYFAIILLYNWKYDIREVKLWVIQTIGVCVLAFLLVLFTMISQRYSKRLQEMVLRKLRWSNVITSNFCGLALISIIMVVFHQSHKIDTTNYHALGYYDSKSNYAGRIIKRTFNPVASPDNRYQFESVVFWNWNGEKGKTKIINPKRSVVYSCFICPELNEVVVHTMDEITVISIDNGESRYLFKQDNTIVRPEFAINKERNKMLAMAFENIVNSKYFLVALDIINGTYNCFEISKRADALTFAEEDTAIASVGDDLIKVEFDDAGNHRFIVDSGGAKKGGVEAVYQGKYVYHRPTFRTEENTDEHVLEFGDVEVPLTDPVMYVHATQSYIWAIDDEEGVIRIDSIGDKVCMDTLDPNNWMIGSGIVNDNLWIAHSDGTVELYGESKNTTQIELPEIE